MNTTHDVLAFAEALQAHTTRMWAWSKGINVAVSIVDIDDGRIILEFHRVASLIPDQEPIRRVRAIPGARALVDEMASASATDFDDATEADKADGLMYPYGVLRYDADGSVALLITHPDGWLVEHAEATARAASRFTFAWDVAREVMVDPPVPPFFYRAAMGVLAE